MALSISRGAKTRAQKVVVYGPEGIGKTTLASMFPNPLFVDTEDGTGHLDVARVDPAPKSWTALMETVRAVKAERPCSTLVVDTADWAEAMCMEHVCAKNKWSSIETPGFGAGYTQLREEFGRFLDALSDVADSGVNVVVTAHAQMRKFEQPDEAAPYDRWELKLQKKVAPVVKEWADAVLFLNWKTTVETVSAGMGQVKGKARNAKRTMFCEHHACWDAKNRWGLSSEEPMDYSVIAPHVPDLATAAPAPNAAVGQPSQPTQAAQPSQRAADSDPRPVQTIVFGQDGSVVSDTARPAVADLPGEDGLPECWAPALQLMRADGVTVADVVEAVAAKGYYTADTPPANYDPAFVRGVIVGAWPQIRDFIRASVPFE